MITSFAVALIVAAQGRPLPSVEPWAGGEVSAAVHVDLDRIDVSDLLVSTLGPAAKQGPIPGAERLATDWLAGLRKAKASDLFLLVDPADIPGIPVAVVPLWNEADGRAVAAAFKNGVGPIRWPAAEEIRGAIVAGSPAAVARIKAAQPAARTDLDEALAEGSDSPIRIVIAPATTQRRALQETAPTLPAELGGGPISVVTQGLRWASLSLATAPGSRLRLVAQAKDAAAALALETMAKKGLATLADTTRKDPAWNGLADAVGRLAPEVAGDRLTLDADLKEATQLVSVPMARALEASQRTQSVNNLKNLGLAMHNFHSEKNAFPPAFLADKAGKPLLSWRVLILPYLDAKALYDQFHLDEPWDSTHNKALIAKMPPFYDAPAADRALAAAGKTVYLTPRGPATMFPGAQGVKIQDVTDGTSNTILVVEANADSAAIWTKPDDLSIGEPVKGDGLFGLYADGTDFLYADGSVRFLKAMIKPTVLKALLTRNGGEVISSDDY